MRAGGDELRPGLQRVNKRRAGCGKIKSPNAFHAKLVLYQAGGGREQHVRRDRRNHHGFDGARLNPTFGQCVTRRFGSKVTGRHTLIYNVSLANAGAARNPLVRSLNHLLQIGIGQKPRRHIGSQSGYLRAHDLTQMGNSPVFAMNSE